MGTDIVQLAAWTAARWSGQDEHDGSYGQGVPGPPGLQLPAHWHHTPTDPLIGALPGNYGPSQNTLHTDSYYYAEYTDPGFISSPYSI